MSIIIKQLHRNIIEKINSIALNKGFISEGAVLDYAFESGWFRRRRYDYNSMALTELIRLQERLGTVPDKVAD